MLDGIGLLGPSCREMIVMSSIWCMVWPSTHGATEFSINDNQLTDVSLNCRLFYKQKYRISTEKLKYFCCKRATMLTREFYRVSAVLATSCPSVCHTLALCQNDAS